MIQLEIKISPRLVNQISSLERFAGQWDRLALSPAIASEDLARQAILSGSKAALILDTTSTVPLDFLIDKSRIVQNSERFIGNAVEIFPSANESQQLSFSALANYIDVHDLRTPFDRRGIETLNDLLSGTAPRTSVIADSLGNPGVTPFKYRTSPIYFTLHTDHFSGEEVVFPTVSPFLVEQRLEELVRWVNVELQSGNFHPLFVIATFHLLFLQIHPYQSGSHRLSILLVWKLLQDFDFGFVRYAHFAPQFLTHLRQYAAVLRQAEKTALGNWSTINAWFEFFLDALVETSCTLIGQTEKHVKTLRLTVIQRRILDIVKAKGQASRERIASESGINISTIKYNLSVLAARGHLRREGQGRTTTYSVA